MNKSKDTINWALVGAGGISNKFLEGLRATDGNPSAIVSRSMEKAKDFALKNNIEKYFDNYEQMLDDPSIDVVYIGTPHPTHKDLTISALKAKKAVLCEKPSAINAAELKEMVKAARENNSFFMEAMWTRFLPPLLTVRKWLSLGLLGEVKMVQANFGYNAQYDPKSRIFDPHQGGGALLDAGIYPLSLISMVFGGIKPADIKSQLYIGESGTDEKAAVILSYGDDRIAYAAAANRTELANEAWIYGTKGKIYIPNFICARTAKLYINGKDDEQFQGEFISNGYNYQAIEVMNCLREGKIESSVMTWDESIVLMETMDAIRAQWNFRYPAEI